MWRRYVSFQELSYNHLKVECLGFSITLEELAAKATEYTNYDTVTGWANLGAVISILKTGTQLRWANPLDLKNAVEAAFAERFGAKDTAKPKGKVRARHIYAVDIQSHDTC